MAAKPTYEELEQQLQEKKTELTAVLSGAQSILKNKEFSQAAREIFDYCSELLGSTSGYIALLSEDGHENEVLFLEAGGRPCTVDPSLPMPIRGLRAEAYHTRQATYDNDFWDSKWMKYLPKGHVTLDNVLFAPLNISGQTVGIMGIANKPGGFNDNDARLATAFGELAAIALENSRNLEFLEHSEARFRSVVETALDAIITCDKQGVISVWNQAAENIFGFKKGEMIGENITKIVPEHLRRKHIAGLKRVVTTGKKKIIGSLTETVGLQKDGSEIPIELSLTISSSGEFAEFTSIIRDVTDRKQAEEALRKTHEQLLHSEKLAAIGGLSASIAHEFNNPLAGITNIIHGLKRRATYDEDDAELIDIAITECARIKDLIKSLQDFNRPSSGRFALIDLHATIDSLLILSKNGREKTGITIATNYDENMPQVKVVADQIKQVILNLLNNAIYACEEGGNISISTATVRDNVVIKFKDNGKGIKPEHIDNIFDPFFTTKPEVKGTGLGLSVSYGIIKRHGGRIDVESKPEMGTTFTITLPIEGKTDAE